MVPHEEKKGCLPHGGKGPHREEKVPHMEKKLQHIDNFFLGGEGWDANSYFSPFPRREPIIIAYVYNFYL